MTGPLLDEVLDQMAARVQARAFQQAWIEAHVDYWERRAQRWEAAGPRRGDFLGYGDNPPACDGEPFWWWTSRPAWADNTWPDRRPTPPAQRDVPAAEVAERARLCRSRAEACRQRGTGADGLAIVQLGETLADTYADRGAA